MPVRVIRINEGNRVLPVGTRTLLSGIGFLGRRPLVPVGAGVVMGRVGTLVVARVPLDGRTTGDHKGPHSTTQPLPPLRGRSRFPCLFAKNLYLKGQGSPRQFDPPPTPRDAINRVPTSALFPHLVFG